MATRVGGRLVPVVRANTVVVGTGSAGYRAAEQLVRLGRHDVVMVTDKVRAGTSRNAGSDKQTYYKLTLSGDEPDSVRELAGTLFAGGAMDGDLALVEAATSARAFLHLCELGVPFPQDRFGEFVGYKTDHDPRRRATSAGPHTSRSMVEHLEQAVGRAGVRVFDGCRVVDLVTSGGGVVGLLVLRADVPPGGEGSPFLLFCCRNVVYATGGPAALYAQRVYPHGQWGASGAAYRAGARGKNLTEWQFGLASLRPRWNVSGTYMQVVPRFVSTDAAGHDEREFLAEAVPDYGRLASLVFLKGYEWPFDVRKARAGSSLVDLLVYRETVLRSRRVFLDFRRNPLREQFDVDALAPAARDYLARADALFGTPVERLKRMNLPAYELYLGKNPGVDLATDMLEVDVCAQHNNGGLAVDAWWQSDVAGLFPVGEAAGTHGVYRPGGAALNSGQVGAIRAASFIAARRSGEPVDGAEFAAVAGPVLAQAAGLVERAVGRGDRGMAETDGDLLAQVGELLSAHAGPIRSEGALRAALDRVRRWLAGYADVAVVDPTSRRSLGRLFLTRDVLTTALVYLSAMVDYVATGGRSRGSALYTDAAGELPVAGWGPTPDRELALPEEFRFRLDGGELDGRVQEVELLASAAAPEDGWHVVPAAPGEAAAPQVALRWRPVRPIPRADDFFENVWREFREDGNVR